MAVILEKDLVRETTVVKEDRVIMVTLTKKQEITLKLKGMKSGAVSINIDDLYNQLNGGESSVDTSKKGKKRMSNVDELSPMINLHDFRSQYLIDPDLPLDYKIKLENITTNLIKNFKK